MPSSSQTPVYQVIYVSAATRLFSKAELLDLLKSARDNNERLGVTGMLLYKDGDFIQLLEGDEAVVKPLLAHIMADPCHHTSMVLLEEHTDARLFPGWSMGFRDLADPAVQALPGFSDFLNTPNLPDRVAHDPHGCLQLLAMFKPAH